MVGVTAVFQLKFFHNLPPSSVLVYNALLECPIPERRKTDKEGDFVLRVQMLPEKLRVGVNIIHGLDALRLPLKAGKRVPVAEIGVQKMSDSRQRRIFKGLAKTGRAFRVGGF